MRTLVAIALFLAVGLSYLFLGAEPTTSFGARIETEVIVESPTLAPRADELSDVIAVEEREAVKMHGASDLGEVAREAADPQPARILVTVQPKSALEAPPSLAGLRVRASPVKSDRSFDGTPVSAEGRSEISVGGGGRYRVEVDPASVPEGYVASGKVRLGFLDESGVAGAFIEVEDGQTVSVTLTIFGTSRLSGIVTGPGGGPLDGVTVRAQGLAPGMAGLSCDAVTDVAGSFDVAGLLPFVYGLNVVDVGPHATDLEHVPQPARQLFDLRHGSYEGLHLSIGSGQITVAGSVVDELGAPFERVSVRAFYVGDEAHGVALGFPRAYDWSDRAFLTRTDAAGKFRVAGLGAVPLRIQVGAEEARNGPGRRAKFVPDPVEVMLGPGSPGLVNVGSIEVARSRRFVVEGKVVLAAADHPELRLKRSRVELRVHPYEQGSESVTRPGMESRPFLEYDKRTGVFALSCDTPMDDCTLTLALRGHPSLDKEFRFQPVANETLSGQVLSFP